MKKLVFISILVLITVLVYFSVFTVKETEYVIVTQFGRPVGEPLKTAGLYFKLPVQLANRINKQVNIFKTQPIQLLLKDKNPVIITCYVCWRVDNPFVFFQSITTPKVAVQKIGDMINNYLGSTLGGFNIDSIISAQPEKVKLTEIEQTVAAETNKIAQQRYGIRIVDVGIRRLNYPQIVAESVYNRMRAEREKEARKFRAEGMEAAAKIEAETDKEVESILSNAYKQSEIIKGEGDKRSMEIYADAYSKDPEFFEFLKSIETYADILKNKSTLILSTESDIFKYLDGIKQEK